MEITIHKKVSLIVEMKMEYWVLIWGAGSPVLFQVLLKYFSLPNIKVSALLTAQYGYMHSWDELRPQVGHLIGPLSYNIYMTV